MLSTSQVSYQYPKSELISFPDINVEINSSLLIQGESGSGKTTLMHLLAGLIQPKSGSISVHNEDIHTLSPYKKDAWRGQHIGLVYQQAYFIESLSILENIMLSPYAKNMCKAIEIAERLGVSNLLSRKPYQLSTGQLQRVSICRAMMNAPQLILADEPTSALDDKNCEEVLHLLLQEAKQNKAVLVIVTHDTRLKSEIDNLITLEAL